MNANDVKDALLGKFPPSEYLSIYEAPQSSDRSGRKLDVVVVSLWKSRGLALDGIEIKVSMSDWKRELDNPDKADWWHARVSRFWIAAPAEVAKKIRPQLPPNWGLLSCASNGVRALVTPEANRDRIALEWPEVVGLLRATAGCGVNVLARQHAAGREQGYAEAKRRYEGASAIDARVVQGPDVMADRLSHHADQLRHVADVTERLADSIARAFIEPPDE